MAKERWEPVAAHGNRKLGNPVFVVVVVVVVVVFDFRYARAST